jgi:hypothetical protein
MLLVGTDRERKTGGLRALLAHDDGIGLNYAGAAFIALRDDERAEFLAEIERLTASWAAFKSSPWSDVNWCQPKLAVRVKHLLGGKPRKKLSPTPQWQRTAKVCFWTLNRHQCRC